MTTLFQHELTVLIGWIHYLSFDLFVGSWIVADNARSTHVDGLPPTLPRWAMAPILVLTLMFGPAGLLAWLVVRRLRG